MYMRFTGLLYGGNAIRPGDKEDEPEGMYLRDACLLAPLSSYRSVAGPNVESMVISSASAEVGVGGGVTESEEAAESGMMSMGDGGISVDAERS